MTHTLTAESGEAESRGSQDRVSRRDGSWTGQCHREPEAEWGLGTLPLPGAPCPACGLTWKAQGPDNVERTARWAGTDLFHDLGAALSPQMWSLKQAALPVSAEAPAGARASP